MRLCQEDGHDNIGRGEIDDSFPGLQGGVAFEKGGQEDDNGEGDMENGGDIGVENEIKRVEIPMFLAKQMRASSWIGEDVV